MKFLEILIIIAYVMAYAMMTEKERKALHKMGLRKGFMELTRRAIALFCRPIKALAEGKGPEAAEQEPQPQQEPVQVSERDPWKDRADDVFRMTEDAVHRAYRSATWRFVINDIADVMEGRHCVKEIVVTTLGREEHRLVEYETTEKIENGMSVRTLKADMKPHKTSAEAVGDAEIARAAEKAAQDAETPKEKSPDIPDAPKPREEATDAKPAMPSGPDDHQEEHAGQDDAVPHEPECPPEEPADEEEVPICPLPEYPPAGEEDAPMGLPEFPTEEEDTSFDFVAQPADVPDVPSEIPIFDNKKLEPPKAFDPFEWYGRKKEDLAFLMKKGTSRFLIPDSMLPKDKDDRKALFDAMPMLGFANAEPTGHGVMVDLVPDEETPEND